MNTGGPWGIVILCVLLAAGCTGIFLILSPSAHDSGVNQYRVARLVIVVVVCGFMIGWILGIATGGNTTP